MKLSTLSILLGLGVGLPQVYGLMNPAKFREGVRKFPRSETWGYALMLIGTVWFLWNLNQENISDFAAYKKEMLLGFAVACLGLTVFRQVEAQAASQDAEAAAPPTTERSPGP